MAQTTTYTCDRCGKQQTTRNQFWQMCLHITTDICPTVTSPAYWKHKQEWCRECVEIFGLLPRAVSKNDPVPTPVPTFEELLREIIREEVEAAKS